MHQGIHPSHLDAKPRDQPAFRHSPADGNPEEFDLSCVHSLGSRLRGSDDPFCIRLLEAALRHHPHPRRLPASLTPSPKGRGELQAR